MADQLHTEGTQGPAVKLIVIGKTGTTLLRKGLFIVCAAMLTLPACTSHKRCEAYSSNQKKKNKKHCMAYSYYQAKTVQNSVTFPG